MKLIKLTACTLLSTLFLVGCNQSTDTSAAEDAANATGTVSEQVDKVKSGASDMIEGAGEASSDLKQQIKDMMPNKEKINSAVDAMDEKKEALKQKIDEMMPSEEKVNEVVESIDEKTNNIKKQVQDLMPTQESTTEQANEAVDAVKKVDDSILPAMPQE